MAKRKKIETTAKQYDLQKRRQDIYNMRKDGWTINQIAEYYGINRFTVYRDVNIITQEILGELGPNAENITAQELQVMWDMREKLRPAILEGDIKAIEANVKISEKIAKMTGANAPEKMALDHRVSGQVEITMDDISKLSVECRLELLKILEAKEAEAKVID